MPEFVRQARARLPHLLAVSGLIVALDIASKRLVESQMTLWESIAVWEPFLRLTFILNEGAAFGLSLGTHSRAVFLIFSLLATAFLLGLYLLTPLQGRSRRWALALIIGGAIGNLIDRIRLGQVVDFVDVGIGTLRWPVFNVADAAVTVGAVLLGLSLLRSSSRLEQISLGGATPHESDGKG